MKEKMESRQIKGTRTVSVISGNNENEIRSFKNRTDRKKMNRSNSKGTL
jgi:hypothetical protein